jgi:hypothetical protein
MPIDVHGEEGEAFVSSIRVEERRVSTKALMGATQLLGMSLRTEEIIAVEESGGAAITGYVVAGAAESPRFQGILLVGLMILVLVNINIAVRITKNSLSKRRM